jgi:hypothetical protein
MVLVKAFSMCRARERKSLKLFSAAREWLYRKSRAWRTWAVRMSVGVGEEEGGVGLRVGAAKMDLVGSGVSAGKSS